jgi:hypothetical protein
MASEMETGERDVMDGRGELHALVENITHPEGTAPDEHHVLHGGIGRGIRRDRGRSVEDGEEEDKSSM